MSPLPDCALGTLAFTVFAKRPGFCGKRTSDVRLLHMAAMGTFATLDTVKSEDSLSQLIARRK